MIYSKKKFSAQYLKEKLTDFDQTLYDFFILTRSTLGLLAVIFQKFVREFTLVNVNAPVVATTSWWLHFSALVVALKVKKSIPVDFIIYL